MGKRTVCPKCYQLIELNDNTNEVSCPNCGTKLKLVHKKESHATFDAVTNRADTANIDNVGGVVCKKCGNSLDTNYEYCPFCGTPTRNVCPKCGNVMGDNDLFCSKCGTRAKNSIKSSQSTSKNNSATTHKKAPKKEVINLVKHSICLVLCILLFALSFGPIYGTEQKIDSRYVKVELTAIDYLKVMSSMTKHYDYKKNSKAIERIEDEISSIYDALEEKFSADKVDDKEVEELFHDYIVATLCGMAAIDGNLSTASVINNVCVGVFALSYIFLSFALLVTSLIAVVFSALKLLGKGNKEISDRYLYAMPMLLFLSLLILFLLISSKTGGTITASVAGAFIAKMFFESLAIGLLFVGKIVTAMISKRNVSGAVLKICSVVLAVICIACCFAPAFRGYFVDIDTTEKVPVGLMAVTSLPESVRYDDIKIKDCLSAIGTYIEDYPGESGVTAAIVTTAVFTKYMSEDAKVLSIGYYFAIAAVLMMSIASVLVLSDSKECKALRWVFVVLAILCLIATLAFSVVLRNIVNETLVRGEFEDAFLFKLDGGVISALVLAFGFVATTIAEFALKRSETRRFVE